MRIFDLVLRNWYVSLQIGRSMQARTANKYSVGYTDWEAAKKAAKGYETAQILSKSVFAAREVKAGRATFERDSVLFYEAQIDHALMTWLQYAERHEKEIRVMDFGGGLGSLYYQHRNLLMQMTNPLWGVIEQPHFVLAGKKEFQTSQLQFFETIESCVSTVRPNFIVISSVLQYMQAPYELLESLLVLGLPYVLIHRTMARRTGKEQIAVQHVDPMIYQSSYPLWFMDANRIENIFAQYGYQVQDCFDPFPSSYFGPDDAQTPYISWFVVKKD